MVTTLPLTTPLPMRGAVGAVGFPRAPCQHTLTTKKKRGAAENIQISLKLKLLPPFKKSL